jgi:hypothetical protein
MDDDLKEALDLLEDAHVKLWCHFDPTGRQGAQNQPKEIKSLLKRIRAEMLKHGRVFEGFRRGE